MSIMREIDRRDRVEVFLVIFGIVTIVVVAVVLLQRFDGMTGRGPREVSNGIQASRNVEYHVRCPRCHRKMVPLTECPLCESEIRALAHERSSSVQGQPPSIFTSPYSRTHREGSQ